MDEKISASQVKLLAYSGTGLKAAHLLLDFLGIGVFFLSDYIGNAAVGFDIRKFLPNILINMSLCR
jgi:hypothetical protein